MTISQVLRRLYYLPTCGLSWLVFAIVGLGLNAGCAVMLLLPNRERRGPAVRETIHRLFGAWCAWLHATKIVFVNFHGFTPEALAGPAVYISNHPGLLDAPILLARLPDTICIFKPSLIRNPALGPAAIMGGYVSGDTGVDLIRDVAERITAGRSLLIFPEGTRTVQGVDLNPLKPGFALIATRAQAPVRLIVIRAPRDLLSKAWPWWKPCNYPAHVDIELLGDLLAGPGESATELTERAGRQISIALAKS